MFEVKGSDISILTDVDLRTLVARLALAELRKAGLPLSSVTSGGHQTAPDGGLDVRVSIAGIISSLDFVPRSETGFQVKKSDMNAASITEEMKPKGELRAIFGELAAQDGAYIIVSAQGSVADRPLQDRKMAMRGALSGLEKGERLVVDFYDRERLATWVNSFPGVAAWVMARARRKSYGWSAIGGWAGARVGEANDYLTDGKTCVIDEQTKEREAISLFEAVARIRQILTHPGSCVRLTGLSGVGKTRLVQALFEDGVGADALDPGAAIYTDYSDSIDPTPRDMARELVGARDHAILVVDNCNPATHGELARICGASGSQVSLLSVEYDVRDDEPECTRVFRLQSVSPAVVGDWIKETFPSVSQLDRDRIAVFSDGNFRVAGALADTLQKGETLGQLKSRDLLARIFEQRTGPDINLLQASEDLSLFYSYDGEDTSAQGELARIAALRGIEAQHLLIATAELKRRGIVQARGRWRALLPHAISNRLATFALQRISAPDFDVFCNGLSPRMLRSLSRRLGYLHDSQEARKTLGRWLNEDGRLGDLTALDDDEVSILCNLAPVDPQAILTKIWSATRGPNADALIGASARGRTSLIGLVKALAFETDMFEAAALTLVRFACVESAGHNNRPAESCFRELFQLYLSGTRALINQRIALTRRLIKSSDDRQRGCGILALEGLLKADQFMAAHSFDFGARPRDYGWHPKTQEDVRNWFSKAIGLAVELRNIPGVSTSFARQIRSLWQSSGCQDDLDAAATAFSGGGVWIEGWLSFGTAFRYEGKGMPDDMCQHLERIIDRLKPVDLVSRARSFVLEWSDSGYDVVDLEHDNAKSDDFDKAYDRALNVSMGIGKAIASLSSDLRIVLPEILLAGRSDRAYEFGRGLAQGSLDLREMWCTLTSEYAAAAIDRRNPTLLGGFLTEAEARDANFVTTALDAAISEPSLAASMPYLQARVAMDAQGIARLRMAIAGSLVPCHEFLQIANGCIKDVPPSDLRDLLIDIAGVPNGIPVALRILHMYVYCNKTDANSLPGELVNVSRNLLARMDVDRSLQHYDSSLRLIVLQCLFGSEAEDVTLRICQNIKLNIAKGSVSINMISNLLNGLFDVQPFLALNEFLLDKESNSSNFTMRLPYGNRMPVGRIVPDVLRSWAEQDPGIRYNLLGRAICIFAEEHGVEQLRLSPLFLYLLDQAPDKSAFLGDFYVRFQPDGYGRSLADVLVDRRHVVRQLGDHHDSSVRQWVSDMEDHVARWIEVERQRDRARGESFE